VFIEKIESPGLSHMSWLVGSGGQAAVIDPRRDCDAYLELAARHDAQITLILETHRNEDLISGAPILARLTGATVFHGPNPSEPIRYAETVREGNSFRVGAMEIRVLETPGHTDDSLSFVVIDHATGTEPVAVFTGDALFVGDVGRTDFYPERAREVSGALYDSLQKLLALGDQTMVFPAHGAGSVCGAGMAARELSTIGLERLANPRLQLESREAFVEAKLAEEHVMPPYFRRMEELNARGAEPMPEPLLPPALGIDDFARIADSAVVLDVRGTEAYLGAHVPGSLALSGRLITGFAGWLLEYDEDLALVASSAEQARAAAVQLARIGYDRVRGWLVQSMAGWAAAGHRFDAVSAIDARSLDRRLRRPAHDWRLLDLRSPEEVRSGMLPGAEHVYVGDLRERARELDPGDHYTVVCGSGVRATLGASIMRRHGIHSVDVFLGAMRHLDTPLVEPKPRGSASKHAPSRREPPRP
jgi:hydroxyacylglutathione hydrolase